MKFKNKQNEEVKLEDGRVVWLSRAVATVGVFCVSVDNELYFPMGKRGKAMEEETGKWCLPCGYLDYDENANDGIAREAYEELGLDVYGLGLFDKTTQPFFVNSDPKENRQNVSLSFGTYCVLDSKKFETEKYKLKTNHSAEDNEVEDSDWKTLKWIKDNRDKIAFKHDERIEMFLEKIEQEKSQFIKTPMIIEQEIEVLQPKDGKEMFYESEKK